MLPPLRVVSLMSGRALLGLIPLCARNLQVLLKRQFRDGDTEVRDNAIWFDSRTG